MTQTDRPDLFDQTALALHRQRAGGATFLHEAAAHELSERLQEVNRTFTNAVFIGPEAALWSRLTGIPGRCIADDATLDLKVGECDLIVHGLALHWAEDPVGQLVQMRRALRPDGMMIAALFGGRTLHELRTSFAEAEIAVEGGLSPRVAPMGEIRDLGALLQRANLALPVADSLALTVDYADPLVLCRDLRAMGETNAMAARRRGGLRRETLMAAVSHYATHFARPDGRIDATFEIVFLTGWAPADGQQQPLRPGSARTRLADALRVPERPLGE
ncbi:methyltransferase domain-containing protein [Pontivivens nitratireducens]|uniref:Methyltransferase domain-containing protein n=1 Tax=Pontivivens nitratireducens TaxID=2758038 RepID=A0A6G7VHG8_9RHOB|nr:methyltransferase domain-containing protein [Pontibrevibacter nitratireducens]QIK39340.1 methyltransferase domain-containing protein [Pontibrevibacter nitratireducens]